MKSLLPLCLVLSVGLIACQAPAPEAAAPEPVQEQIQPSDLTLEEILDRHIEALGGRDALDAVQSVQMKGAITSPDYSGVPVTVSIRDGERYKLEIDKQGARTVFGYNGTMAWEIAAAMGKVDPTPMDDAELPSFRRDADISGVLVDYQDDDYQVEVEGKTDRGYKLHAAFDNGDEKDFILDPETFLITQTLEDRLIMGETVKQKRQFGDYREVGGRLWPFKRSTEIAQAGYRQSIVWDEITVNPELSDDVFEMPTE